MTCYHSDVIPHSFERVTPKVKQNEAMDETIEYKYGIIFFLN
jgi:hypothetical protein